MGFAAGKSMTYSRGRAKESIAAMSGNIGQLPQRRRRGGRARWLPSTSRTSTPPNGSPPATEPADNQGNQPLGNAHPGRPGRHADPGEQAARMRTRRPARCRSCMASFNHEAYVEDAVRSVLGQSYERPRADRGRRRVHRRDTRRGRRHRRPRLQAGAAAHQSGDPSAQPGAGRAGGRSRRVPELRRRLASRQAGRPGRGLLGDRDVVSRRSPGSASSTRSATPHPDTFMAQDFHPRAGLLGRLAAPFFDNGNDLCLSSALCRRGAVDAGRRIRPQPLPRLRPRPLGPARRARPAEGRAARAHRCAIVGERQPERSERGDAAAQLPGAPAVLDALHPAPGLRPAARDVPGPAGRHMRRPVRLALLARHSWERTGVGHRVFGDRLFTRLLQTPGYRERDHPPARHPSSSRSSSRRAAGSRC